MAYRIRRLDVPTNTELEGLAAVLLDCVDGGASVGFMHPFGLDRALSFWRQVAAEAAQGKRALLAAEDDKAGIVGTVHLVLAQPDNQPHRADVCKMLVVHRMRKQGIGAALMAAAEALALAAGKTLLVLDTASGEAERLYARMGWTRVGVIPGYALWPGGGGCDTTYFYRVLG